MRARDVLSGLLFAATLAAVGIGAACDDASSCPGMSCDPAIDGTPFDLLDWCQASGECLRDGKRVPACPGADADPPPACALAPFDDDETLEFPVGDLASTLAGRRDLVLVLAPCDNRDAAPPDVRNVEVAFDRVRAGCESANPCDPKEAPTVITCAGVPSSVKNVTVSFTYDGAQGKTTLDVRMQNTSCSYFCASPTQR